MGGSPWNRVTFANGDAESVLSQQCGTTQATDTAANDDDICIFCHFPEPYSL